MRQRIEIRRHGADVPWTYALLDQRQREVAAEILTRNASGALLLSELAPVITLGRRTDPSQELQATPADYQERGIALLPIDRGGLATYHGPGQWVLFVVDRLDRLTGDRRGVRKAVNALLEIARQAALPWEPRAGIREGLETGVWGPRGKIASVGVSIQDGILLHGLALNGYPTPQSFFGMRPCGLDHAPIQFLMAPDLSDEDREQEFERLGETLLASARSVLESLQVS